MDEANGNLPGQQHYPPACGLTVDQGFLCFPGNAFHCRPVLAASITLGVCQHPKVIFFLSVSVGATPDLAPV